MRVTSLGQDVCNIRSLEYFHMLIWVADGFCYRGRSSDESDEIRKHDALGVYCITWVLARLQSWTKLLGHFVIIFVNCSSEDNIKPRSPFQCCAKTECMPWTENHVANIEKGSGGAPTSFVQDCLSSKRVIFEEKIDRNLLMFRTDAFRKVFSEAYRFWGF